MTLTVIFKKGFDVLNLANNHILDHGYENAKKTEKLLDERGFITIGSPTSPHEKIKIINQKGKKIGFLGYNLCEQKNKSNISDIFRDIKNSKKLVDVLVVSLHWGWRNEHMTEPSQEQILLGRKIVDQGADIILGHHSHVFQPVELYKGKVIAHSLGNFIFDMWRLENRIGGILEILIYENLEFSVKIIPIIQTDYKVEYYEKHTEKMNDLIVEKIESSFTREEYKKKLNKKKKQHNREVFCYYLFNMYKFSIRLHFHYLKELLPKGVKIIFSKFKNI